MRHFEAPVLARLDSTVHEGRGAMPPPAQVCLPERRFRVFISAACGNRHAESATECVMSRYGGSLSSYLFRYDAALCLDP